ncbi:MAG: 3-deoxy-7-phosphoheptulonate synthase [Parachlamydiaceae bacterium]|nr:3-deoxy-7-phosphoheptulonate synthase [Parachlamydiaceae bacterium]
MQSDLLILPATLPSPDTVQREMATSTKQREFIASARLKIAEILNGNDQRLLLVVGPCSIHDYDSTMEYAQKLQALSDKVSDHFFVIMRTFFDKARSTVGWQGYASDPYLNGSEDLGTGINLTRKLLLSLAELGVPTAAEILNPISILYFNDLLSWGCIGARTTESQTHRQIASSLPLPIAFKNNTAGNIGAAINGVIAASSPHNFMGINNLGQVSTICSEGNPLAHIVLRGSENDTNYDPKSVQHALNKLCMAKLPKRLMIDCSHGNSNRQHEQQPKVFNEVIAQILSGNKHIRGLCLESHLNPGNQPIPSCLTMLKYGISITDPCMGWEETENLIYTSCKLLKKNRIFDAALF